MTECEDIIPRHTPSNPYNYTNVQLAERKKALIAPVYGFSINHTLGCRYSMIS